MLIDTHTHLYLPDFEEGGEAVVNRAIEAGVGKMVFPNVDLTTIEPMRELASKYPQVKMAMGLHPTEVTSNWLSDLQVIEKEINKHRKDYVAIGEIGIDLYWDKTFRAEQIEVFDRQCALAEKLGLPIIIHCREGLDEVLSVVSNHKLQGVFHSFGGTAEDVRRIRRTGDWYFGINGVVTFKNSGLKDVLPEIGIDRILLETDSPYLTPVPHRGKRNESSYLPYIADFIAKTLDEPDVALITTANAERLFGI